MKTLNIFFIALFGLTAAYGAPKSAPAPISAMSAELLKKCTSFQEENDLLLRQIAKTSATAKRPNDAALANLALTSKWQLFNYNHRAMLELNCLQATWSLSERISQIEQKAAKCALADNFTKEAELACDISKW